MPGRMESIKELVDAELERRRVEIDGDEGLRGVTIVVKISDRNGMPWKLLWRPESEREADCAGAPRGYEKY